MGRGIVGRGARVTERATCVAVDSHVVVLGFKAHQRIGHSITAEFKVRRGALGEGELHEDR